MYTCCICGKTYSTEAAVVKCVNRCGREMSRKGIFQPKEAPYSEGATITTFGFNIENDYKAQIDAALGSLLRNGISPIRVDLIKEQHCSNWENKSEDDKRAAVGKIKLLAQMMGS